MARQTTVTLVDDVDGSEASETVTFGLDGIEYEIDLAADKAAELRSGLARYVAGGRRARRGSGVAPRLVRVETNDYDPAAVRAWASSNRVPLPPRGRIPASVLEQFRAAGN